MVMTTDSDSMTQQQIADAFKNVNKAQNKVMEHRYVSFTIDFFSLFETKLLGN